MSRQLASELGPTAWHIVFLAKRKEGVTPADVERTCFVPRAEARKRLDGLVELGQLRCINGTTRYVEATRKLTPAPTPAADAPAPKPAKPRRPTRQPQTFTTVEPAGIEPPVSIPEVAALTGPAVTPASVKVTHGPSLAYDPRYQVDPQSRPFGAGFAAAGIGRDLLTGHAWALPSPAVAPDQNGG